jgi:proteasome accessory factor A
MMMGTETEYGILGGWSLAKARTIQEAVLRAHPSLPSVKEGEYLDNGGRAYVDLSTHNEFATPETHDPAELVIHELAGRQLMAAAAAQNELALICSNLDPSTGHTWGTHENYEYRREFARNDFLELSTHLVSRIIFTGAGGLDPTHPGVHVILSPRVSRIRSVISQQGVVRKSLIFVKPEDYCQHRRLHVFCGESLLCHTASYLKYASTALVAYCLQEGIKVGPGQFAESPIHVLRKMNRDISLGVRFLMRDGRRLTALEIQQEILRDVAQHIDLLPEWAPSALQHWRNILNELSCGHPSLAGKLDWLVFLKLFNILAAEHNFTLPDIRRLNQIVIGKNRPKRLTPVWKRFATFRAAANELFVRLHVVGKESLFNQIEQRGWLNHRLPEITEAAIARALHEPPPGRAANRSRLVKQFAGQPQFWLSWDKIHHARSQVFAIPENPDWDGQVIWQPIPRSQSRPTEPPTTNFRSNALELFQAGRFDEAETIYRHLLEQQFEYPSTFCHLARLYLHTGRDTEAREAVDRAWLFRREAPRYVIARIHYLNVLLAMLAGEDWTPELLKFKAELADASVYMEWIMASLLEYLRLRLGEEKYALMSAAVAAINNQSQLSLLEANPLWQTVCGGPEKPADPQPVSSPDELLAEEENYTFGKVVKVFGNGLILKEYDFAREADAEHEYLVHAETEYDNLAKLEDLVPNDNIVMNYRESNGQRLISVLVREEVQEPSVNHVQ